MPILSCSVTKCNYNSEGRCCLKNIDVSGGMSKENTCCASFSPSHGASNSACRSNPTSHTDIKCMAKDCTYNSDLKCAADKVKISECSCGVCTSSCADTKCDTFKHGVQH